MDNMHENTQPEVNPAETNRPLDAHQHGQHHGCGQHHHGSGCTGHGCGQGQGRGMCHKPMAEDRETLLAHKAHLEAKLAEVEKKLQAL